MRAILHADDIDRHGAGCSCGRCDGNGRSYGVAIRLISDDEIAAIERQAAREGIDVWELLEMESYEVAVREYAASNASAVANARQTCRRLGYAIWREIV